MATLYTFGPSHFCEKARWALDISGVAYREVRWAPGPHVLAARRMASGSTVPILRSADGIVQGSREVMDWLETLGRAGWCHDLSTTEQETIRAIEERADRGIGIAARRLIYATALSTEPGTVAQELWRDLSWRHKAMARLMWPLTRQIMIKGMRAAAADIPDAEADVERELEHFDTMLGDGRRFLVDDRFTRADITVASLLSPVARPPQHPVYTETQTWDAYRRLIDTYRDRPSILWARRLYGDFRHRPHCN